jgi:hypothetical protein
MLSRQASGGGEAITETPEWNPVGAALPRLNFAQLSNPQFNPQNVISCTICMYLGSLHAVVSCKI